VYVVISVPSCCTNCGPPVVSVLEDINLLSNLIEDPTALDNIDNDEDYTNTLGTMVAFGSGNYGSLAQQNLNTHLINQMWRAEYFNRCADKRVCSVPCCDGLVYAEFKSSPVKRLDMTKYFSKYDEKCTARTHKQVENFVLNQVADRWGGSRPDMGIGGVVKENKAPGVVSLASGKIAKAHGVKTLGGMFGGFGGMPKPGSLPGGIPGQGGMPLTGGKPSGGRPDPNAPVGGKGPNMGNVGGAIAISPERMGMLSVVLPRDKFKTLPVVVQIKLREYIKENLIAFLAIVKRLCTKEHGGRDPAAQLMARFNSEATNNRSIRADSSYFPILKEFFATLLEKVAEIYATPCPCSRLRPWISSTDRENIYILLKAECLKQNCNLKPF